MIFRSKHASLGIPYDDENGIQKLAIFYQGQFLTDDKKIIDQLKKNVAFNVFFRCEEKEEKVEEKEEKVERKPKQAPKSEE